MGVTEKKTLTFLETTRADYEESLVSNERAERMARLASGKRKRPREPGIAYEAVIRRHVAAGAVITWVHNMVPQSEPSLLVECGPRTRDDGGAAGECLLVRFPRAGEMPAGRSIEFYARRGTANIPGDDGSRRMVTMLVYSPEDAPESATKVRAPAVPSTPAIERK